MKHALNPHLPSISLASRPHRPARPAGEAASCLYRSDWKDMEGFNNPAINMAILRRSIPDCPLTLLELLDHGRDSASLAIDRGMPLDLIAAVIDEELDLRAKDSEVFYSDVTALAERFFELTGALSVGVRLERVSSDSCRLFHVDRVDARLITTYFGKGTEWLENSGVDRKGLGQGDNLLVRRNGHPIHVLEAGWVALMKGEGKRPGFGLVHRSPPVEKEAARRILLRMDVLA